MGSRWVLFEPCLPSVWRQLEREVRAFCHELALEGLLPPWGGKDLEVRCEPRTGDAPAAGGPGEGRPSGAGFPARGVDLPSRGAGVLLTVRAALGGEYARFLSGQFLSGQIQTASM